MSTPMQTGRAIAAYIPNGGFHEMIGTYPTVEDAKSEAFDYGAAKVGDFRNFRWRQFSETTWGLMNGGLWTDILVSRIADPAACRT